MKINWCVENLENNLKSMVAVQNDGTVRGGFLVVGKDDFIIKEAAGSYSEQVHDYVENGNEEVTSFNNDFAELIGIEGYIQGKKIVKKRLLENGHDSFSDIFLQCISALLQAETYVYKERGYKTREDYNIYWDFLEKNNCRMYSDSRRTERLADLPWMDYVPDNFEKDILFEREKTYTIEKKNGNIFCKGYLSDTYHEMLTLIKIDSEGIITENKIKIIRAPGVSCFTNDENNNSLMGRKLSEISKRDIISALGGCDGCYHIVEMYIDSHRVLTEKR